MEKKTYFVASDIHGFFTLGQNALKEKGFDENNENHILIICGDMFDRGKEALQMLNYLENFLQDRLIMIRGNHEDLALKCLNEIESSGTYNDYHVSNGTLDTLLQIAEQTEAEFIENYYLHKSSNRNIERLKHLISRTINYYELNDYIFVHGFIPVAEKNGKFFYQLNGRESDKINWALARGDNGIDMSLKAYICEPNKIIVFGHGHCSYAHHLLDSTTEFGEDANFDICERYSFIAIDACTAYSNKVNILKIIQ